MSNPGNPGQADPLGSLIIRNVDPGSGYRWVDDSTGRGTPTFTVLAPGQDPATDASLYTGQPMHEGLNYITMRDGVQLAATVRYPYGGSCSAASPCPTVVEYSGYATAGPTDPIPTCWPRRSMPRAPAAGTPTCCPTAPPRSGSVLARVAGFATVSLQMRGTGCSGGAFDLFGYPSDYDAYDAVEIVAHQSWVARHKVGMVGISYSGLSEFPSAGTDPPDLAAIAPMSPTDDLFSTGYPGGIYNDGFAASWIAQRIDDAKPAAAYGDGRLVPSVGDPGGQRGPAVDLLRDRRRAGRRRGSVVHLPGRPGPPRPVREPRVTRRSPAGRPRHGAGTQTRRCSTGGRWSSGPPTSRSPSSCPGPCRTSRRDRSGRH